MKPHKELQTLRRTAKRMLGVKKQFAPMVEIVEPKRTILIMSTGSPDAKEIRLSLMAACMSEATSIRVAHDTYVRDMTDGNPPPESTEPGSLADDVYSVNALLTAVAHPADKQATVYLETYHIGDTGKVVYDSPRTANKLMTDRLFGHLFKNWDELHEGAHESRLARFEKTLDKLRDHPDFNVLVRS